jgi:hypothetical protein
MRNISKIMVFALLSITLVGWVSPSEAGLDNLQQGRCERTNRLVKLGDHYSQVIQECGEPDAVIELGYRTASLADGESTYIENGRVVKFYGESNSVRIEEWTYLNGWKKRPLLIKFSGGVVESISLGDI